MSELVQINPEAPDPEIIRRACELLEAGELVGVPTETVYGIACDPAHLEKIYAAKERDRGKPVARLAASLEQVEALGAKFGKYGRALAENYWPGPLTLVLETPEGTTGFRVPDHEVPLALARAFGKPIALTSANKSGDTDALNAQEAFQCFQALDLNDSESAFGILQKKRAEGEWQNPVALYLESFQPLDAGSTGGQFVFQGLEKSDANVPRVGGKKQAATPLLPNIGKLVPPKAVKPSTVVHCLETEIKILREGAVSKEELEKLIEQ